MRVLVTGSTGFVGRRLVGWLTEQGCTPLRTARAAQTGALELDLLRPEQFREVLKRAQVEVIVNLAAAATHGNGATVTDIYRANVVGPLGLLEAAVDCGVRRFVQVGSALEYGPSSEPLNEGSPLGPAGTYAVSKACAWWSLRDAASRSPIQFAEARLFNIFGPGNALPRLDACIQQGAREGTPVNLSRGTQRRDFLGVDEAAAELGLLLLAPDSGFPDGEAINIARGEPRSLREFAELLATRLGAEHLLRFSSEPLSSCQDLFTHAERWRELRSALGAAPMPSLAAAVAKFETE